MVGGIRHHAIGLYGLVGMAALAAEAASVRSEARPSVEPRPEPIREPVPMEPPAAARELTSADIAALAAADQRRARKKARRIGGRV
jgi:hypothetical protein